MLFLLQTVQHGFPNKPSAVAWDPLLRLMAIGTSVGAIKVFGRPGVEFYGQHTTFNANADIAITQLVFLPGMFCTIVKFYPLMTMKYDFLLLYM